MCPKKFTAPTFTALACKRKVASFAAVCGRDAARMPNIRLTLCRAGQETTGPFRPVLLSGPVAPLHYVDSRTLADLFVINRPTLTAYYPPSAPCTYAAIHAAACNKLQLKGGKKKARLFTRGSSSSGASSLREILPEDGSSDQGLLAGLRNGSVIVACADSDRRGAGNGPPRVQVYRESLPPLPPGPGNSGEVDAHGEDEDPRGLPLHNSPIVLGSPGCATLADEGNRYHSRAGGFARLDGNVLSAIREAVAGQPALTETNHGEYIVFDYSADRSSEVHPCPVQTHTSTRQTVP